MIPQHAKFLCQLSVVGDNRSALAESAQVFSRVETEAAGKTNRPGLSTLVFGPVSLAGIFD